MWLGTGTAPGIRCSDLNLDNSIVQEEHQAQQIYGFGYQEDGRAKTQYPSVKSLLLRIK